MKPILALFALLTVLGSQSNAAEARCPNILVIFTDDLDFEEVGALAKYIDAALAGEKAAQPGKPVLTLNLDRLVGESLTITQFHVASVVCTPSRYALLTGQYGSRSASLRKRHPVTGAANVQFNTDVEPGQWHVARGLKDAGYTTGIVGKWHNRDKVHGDFVIRPPICDYTGKEIGPRDPALPESARRVRSAYDNAIRHLTRDIGWDHAGSIYIGNTSELGLPKPLWEVEHNMEWFTAGAVKFLEAQKSSNKPLFLYFAPIRAPLRSTLAPLPHDFGEFKTIGTRHALP